MNCYSYEDKVKYFKYINKYYNYNDNVINMISAKQISLCKFNYINNIKLIEPALKQKILNLMDKVVKFLDDNDIEYWLDSGTLLGAVRDAKFIPWDDDVDLAIPPKSQYKIYELCKTYPHVSHKIKFYICEKYNIKLLIRRGIIKIFNNDDTSLEFIDLICYYKKNNTFCSVIFEYKGENYNIKDVYPLKKIKFENKYYKCVNNPIPFLNSTYWFWRHVGVASHAHFELIHRNKNIYFIFKNIYSRYLHKHIKNKMKITNKNKKYFKNKIKITNKNKK